MRGPATTGLAQQKGEQRTPPRCRALRLLALVIHLLRELLFQFLQVEAGRLLPRRGIQKVAAVLAISFCTENKAPES